jgi:hypothetical protein
MPLTCPANVSLEQARDAVKLYERCAAKIHPCRHPWLLPAEERGTSQLEAVWRICLICQGMIGHAKMHIKHLYHCYRNWLP